MSAVLEEAEIAFAMAQLHVIEARGRLSDRLDPSFRRAMFGRLCQRSVSFDGV
jgi:hypothetical protein